jgi:hypothetical protein
MELQPAPQGKFYEKHFVDLEYLGFSGGKITSLNLFL